MTILTPLLPKFKRWLGSKDVLQEDEFCQSILLNLDKNDEIMKEVTDYLNESGNCEPLLYANSIKNLKNLLYNL